MIFPSPVTQSCRCWAVLLGVIIAMLPDSAMAIFIVNQPWVLPAAKGSTTEAFMVLQSSDGAALVGVRSETSAGVAILSVGAKAVVIDRLALPRGEAIKLAPGKVRLRLSTVSRMLKLGDRVPLLLTIEAADGSRQDIAIDAEVRQRSPVDDERRAHRH